MDADEDPCAALRIEADDGLLAVPRPQEILEHTVILPVFGYTPPPVWPESAQS